MTRLPRLLALLTVPAVMLGLVAAVPAGATTGASWNEVGVLPTDTTVKPAWLPDGTALAAGVAAGTSGPVVWTRTPGATGAGWTSTDLDPNGLTFNGRSALAVSPQGDALAVFAVSAGTEATLAAYRRTPAGSWQYLGTAALGSNLDRPRVAASPNGGFVVLASTVPSDTIVSWRVPAGATAWPAAISNGLGSTSWATLTDASLAIGDDGTAYLATILTTSLGQVSLLRLDPGATSWSPPLIVSENGEQPIQPQVVMGGPVDASQPVVVWKTDIGGTWQVRGSVAPLTWTGQAVGGLLSTIRQIPADPAPADVPVVLAAAPSGVVSVAWTVPVEANTRTQVSVAVVDPASDVPTWEPADATLRQPPTTIRDLALTASGSGADGRFTLVWTGPAPSGGGVQVGSQWWEDGTTYSPEVTTVLASGIELAGGPALNAAGGPDGSVVALAQLADSAHVVFEDLAPRPSPLTPPSLVPAFAPRVSIPVECDPGEWERRLATQYRWLRNGALISGATTSTYVPKVGDLGTTLQCRVGASSAAGTTTVASVGRTVLVGPPADATSRPKITGTPAVGSRLTCSKGTWQNQSALTFGVSWKRGSTTIAGATRFTYIPVRADKGKRLTCRVTAARTGYQTGVATSAAVTIR